MLERVQHRTLHHLDHHLDDRRIGAVENTTAVSDVVVLDWSKFRWNQYGSDSKCCDLHLPSLLVQPWSGANGLRIAFGANDMVRRGEGDIGVGKVAERTGSCSDTPFHWE